jgi:hypothetical protein
LALRRGFSGVGGADELEQVELRLGLNVVGVLEWIL